MANPKLATLQDGFTGASINTGLWNSITGTAVLDGTNDLVTLAQPTVNGTTNSFGSTALFDATSSQIWAEVGPAANGNGFTGTLFRVAKDASNWIAIRLLSGVFTVGLTTAGTTVSTALPAFNPNLHGWWEIAENGAGSFVVSTSPDGFNWTVQATLPYTWAATAVTFSLQTTASGTEAAGNVATIQHVNTMLGGPFNINWPLLEEAWGAHWACNGGDSPLDRYVEVTDRTRQQSTVDRGKQYELDQIRAGEASVELVNTDGVLDPVNSSGPFYGHILPFQPYRKRAQWPRTRNLLTQAQATGGDLGGQPVGTINTGNNGPSIFTSTDSSGGSIASTASAWQGGTVLQFAVNTTATIPSFIVYTPQVAVEPGVTYTVSIQARDITASSTVQVAAAIQWLDATQTPISTSTGTPATLTGSATAAWTGFTGTGTAPANAAMMYVGLQVTGAPSANCTVQVDGWQLEKATTASSWACPGVWYPWFAGFTERWPSQWDMHGTYGTVQPTAVDAAALLSQMVLKDTLTHEIFTRNPRFLYTLGDPQGSNTAADATGHNPQAAVAVSRYGAGTLTFGTQITSAAAGGTYTGSSNTVMTVAGGNPGTNLVPSVATFISLSGAGIKGPASMSSWTRMIAFRWTNGSNPANAAVMWSALDAKQGGGSQILFQLSSIGSFQFVVSGPTGVGSGTVYQPTTTSVADGNWHLAIVGYSASTGQFYGSIDSTSGYWGSIPTTQQPSGMVGDNIGSFVDPSVGNGTTYTWKGDLSYACEFPGFLGPSDTSALYTAWKNACAGESTNARYARILNYAGYIGVSSVQTGLTTSMGPASFDGQDALSALQAVVDTENGQHFVDRAGTVTFQARSARYNATVPTYVFGENTAGGEWPYEDCQLDYDPTHLGNLIQVTQASTNQVFAAQDATSQTNYFPRTLTRTINSSSTAECQDAANYLLSRYKGPATRVSSVVLHPAANPQMWPVVLSLEIGMRVRVMRRPPAPASPIQVDCFIENIQTSNDDAGDAVWTLQCSPADLTPYGLYASFHTTLSATIASGVGSITINAGADNTNPAASQISSGQQLVLGQNTANQETVTVKAVAATSSGWSTCVITLTANTTKSHTAGDIVCEPLPTGVTDPTTYDNSSKLDSVALSY